MNSIELAPVAGFMVSSYMDTAAYSKRFLSEHEYPPTAAAKAHHLRSVVQAEITHHGQFELSTAFIELGRVEFLDTATGETYLLRSDRALEIERTLGQNAALFDTTDMISSEVRLLIYKFHLTGLDLSVAGTKRVGGSRRLVASGVPTYIGTWPYSLWDGGGPFDQGAGDPFAELGGLEGFDEEGGE